MGLLLAIPMLLFSALESLLAVIFSGRIVKWAWDLHGLNDLTIETRSPFLKKAAFYYYKCLRFFVLWYFRLFGLVGFCMSIYGLYVVLTDIITAL